MDDHTPFQNQHNLPEKSQTFLAQVLSSEQNELKQKRLELAKLEAELAERELELSTLLLDVDKFANQYRIHIGSRYARLDEIEAQIAESLAAKDPLDQSARENANSARDQARKTREETGTFDDQEIPSTPAKMANFHPSDELKQLRLKLSKLAHPDLAANEDDRHKRTKFMQQVNEAYASQNLERLDRLLEEWEANSGSSDLNTIEAELESLNRKMRILRTRLQSIQREISEIRTSEIFAIKLDFESAELEGRNLFAEICAELDIRIANAQLYLKKLNEAD